MAAKQNRALNIVEILEKVNDGGALEDVRDLLRKCCRLVDERGGQGSVTLTLSVKKMGRGQLTITDAVKLSEPKKVNDPSIFFIASPDGDLSRNNPDQFPLMEAEEVED